MKIDNVDKSVLGEDGNMYFCTDRNTSDYEFTNYYPESIQDNHFCADFNGDDVNYGFCRYKDKSPTDSNCIIKK
jgi:hypothetical protein